MLSKLKVERFFEHVNQRSSEVVTAKQTPMPEVLIEFMDKLTLSRLSVEAETRLLPELGDSLLGVESRWLPRAIALRVQFGHSCYSVAEVAMLLKMPLVFVLAVVEKYGEAWPERMRVKTLGRFRGEHTIFKGMDSTWHTPLTYAHVYKLNCPCVMYALKSGDWGGATPSHGLVAVGHAWAYRDGGGKIDPFGPPASAYRVPLFTYPVFATKADYLRSRDDTWVAEAT